MVASLCFAQLIEVEVESARNLPLGERGATSSYVFAFSIRVHGSSVRKTCSVRCSLFALLRFNAVQRAVVEVVCRRDSFCP